MSIRPVGAELFPEDRRTDEHPEVNSRFAQFCVRAYKNQCLYGNNRCLLSARVSLLLTRKHCCKTTEHYFSLHASIIFPRILPYFHRI
jgi:hypothetical protein